MKTNRFSAVEMLAVIAVIALLGGVALPRFGMAKAAAKGVETKGGGHFVQVALERFATDHQGHYPDYLIGGAAEYSQYEAGNGANPFSDITAITDPATLSDLLLREGYLLAYPKNPFATYGGAIHRFQDDIGDPLRNGTDEGKLHGTRFGPLCEQMGNVLADFRFTEFTAKVHGSERTFASFAGVEYAAFDLWETSKVKPFLPGELFYKSMGPVATSAIPDADEPLVPRYATSYILGAYGSIRSKGADVLGPEPMLSFGGKMVPAWTRSTKAEANEDGRYLGSPYGAASEHKDARAVRGISGLFYGNPNGIRDGIVIVLTSED